MDPQYYFLKSSWPSGWSGRLRTRWVWVWVPQESSEHSQRPTFISNDRNQVYENIIQRIHLWKHQWVASMIFWNTYLIRYDSNKSHKALSNSLIHFSFSKIILSISLFRYYYITLLAWCKKQCCVGERCINAYLWKKHLSLWYRLCK